MVAALDSIKIKNAGPIDFFEVKFPRNGGVTIIKAPNGGGKSLTLAGIENLMGIKTSQKVRKMEGSQLDGVIEGLGVTLRLGYQNRRTGKLAITGLGDEFRIDELVDPRDKDPVVADMRRLKSFLRGIQAQADPQLFFHLLGNEEAFRAIVTPSTMEKDDIVDLAAAIKRDIDRKALAEEEAAKSAATHASAIRDSIKDLDYSREINLEALQGEYSTKVQTKNQLEFSAKMAKEAQAKAAIAREKLREAESTPRRPLKELEAENGRLTEEILGMDQQIKALEDQLKDLRQQRDSRSKEADALVEQISTTATLEASLAGWRQTIANSESLTCPSQEEIDAVVQEISQIEDDIKNAGVIERAKKQAQEAAQYEVIAEEHGTAAANLRTAAAGTNDVLTKLVADMGSAIIVKITEQGIRLMVRHERRGEMFLADLSKGEKLSLVLPIVMEAARKFNAGLMVIPQEMWEGLDPSNRELVYEMACGSGVAIITAECDDGELRCEVIEEWPVAA